jgi:flagellar basal-body rod protein FlgF
MQNTSYVALSYAAGLERKMDMVANNIANVNTTGFKSTHMLFNEYVVNERKQKPVSMVEDVGNYKDFTPGTLQQTGNPLDVALEGHGFLSVTTANGEKYTRAGAMHLDEKGQLLSSGGDAVNDESGKPIVIPPGAGNITITSEGSISTDKAGTIGKLKVVSFANPQKMKPIGNNNYETDETGTADPKTTVLQGAVEGSNVNSVMEMSDMIEISRRYESVAQILQNQNDSEISMIQRLSKIE